MRGPTPGLPLDSPARAGIVGGGLWAKVGQGGNLARFGSRGVGASSGRPWLPPSRASMLLTGTYPRTLDDKKRLALAKRVREQLGDPKTLFVTPGPDQCLWLYTQDGLERLAGKPHPAPPADPQPRLLPPPYLPQTHAR